MLQKMPSVFCRSLWYRPYSTVFIIHNARNLVCFDLKVFSDSNILVTVELGSLTSSFSNVGAFCHIFQATVHVATDLVFFRVCYKSLGLLRSRGGAVFLVGVYPWSNIAFEGNLGLLQRPLVQSVVILSQLCP